jgi:LysM repeat protein
MRIPVRTKFNRRTFLGSSLALGVGGALLHGSSAVQARATSAANHHLVWVWQFATDGEPAEIAARLQPNGLGIILKAFDGTRWMSDFDRSPYAISGLSQAGVLAGYFESEGVPFHAWCVLHGSNPAREAEMAASVLEAGARSLWLDVEPHPGFWRSNPEAALRFGEELRRLQPNARVVLSIDPRPWHLGPAPLGEFASFSNLIAPQQYWGMFNTRTNRRRFLEAGFPVPSEGVTPEFLIGVSDSLLAAFGLPVHHVGQDSSQDATEWDSFVETAFAGGTDFVSVWRYGITTDQVFGVLRDKPARQPPAAAAGGVYVVQPGDTLGAIAAAHRVSVASIVSANGLADPNFISPGQRLIIPGAGPSSTAVSSGGRSHTVQPGETLFGIAGRYGTTVDAIAQANGLTDPNFIVAGRELVIP